ncbi:hypothetical protein YSKK_26110 [Halopseudomonas aestusnigri]|nr:hypothetical protein YSKK_26110 [Halopseudomonas aestusnigri]
MRSESGNGIPFSSRASRIERSLIISNGFPSFPGRTWRKKTGDPSLIRTSNIKHAIMGHRKNKAITEKNISKIRLSMTLSKFLK